MISSTAWLHGVQAVRWSLSGFQGGLIGGFISPAFAVVVPLDVSLSLSSQNAALRGLFGLSKPLERLLGENMGRAATNTIIGGSYIAGFWKLSEVIHNLGNEAAQVSVTPMEYLTGFALCGLIYPVAQYWKVLFFKGLPLRRDLNRLEEWESNSQIGASITRLKEAAIKRAKELEISTEDAEALSLVLLDTLVMNTSFELRITPEMSLSSYEGVARIKRDIELARKQSKQVRLRRKLIRTLLDLYTVESAEMRQEIEAVLDLGEDPATSIEIHRRMQERYRHHGTTTQVLSMVDQGVMVGVGGGILLYLITKWVLEPDEEEDESQDGGQTALFQD